MSATTTRSGELAQAVVANQRLARMTQWSLTDTVSETAWGDSDNGIFTVRKRARREATGDFQGKYETTQAPTTLFVAGDCCSLVLWEDITDAQAYWYFSEVLIRSYSVTFNQDSKEVVGWSATWASSGRYYAPYESGAPAATAPTVPE
jgi:hypothetical protein